MRCEIPELGRCCFCFPLRLGLIVWGYIKIIVNLILLVCIVLLTEDMYNWHDYWTPTNLPFTIIQIIIVASLVADIIFHIIFAIGAHKKDPKKIELFSRFCIYILILYIAGFFTSIIYFANDPNIFTLCLEVTLGAVFFACISSQLYIIILVRSEAVKLKRGSNFQFVNHAAESNMDVKLDLNNQVV